MSEDKIAQENIEHLTATNELIRSLPPSDTKPAGPHATRELTDHSKTPGTGSLPDNLDIGEADIGSA